MHQDELNGWKLRVYPSRQPTALLEGEWEEYRDEMDPEGGRPLYYNRYQPGPPRPAEACGTSL